MGAEERIRVCGYGRYRMGGWVGERCRGEGEKKSDIRGRRGRRGHKKVVDAPHSLMIPLNVMSFINGWPSCISYE